MKHVTFALANSVTDVLNEIEWLHQIGKLSRLGCQMLEMFYVTGWDDGFVEVTRPSLGIALQATSRSINNAILELERLRLASVRQAEHHEAIELLSLSARNEENAHLGWWQMYTVDLTEPTN